MKYLRRIDITIDTMDIACGVFCFLKEVNILSDDKINSNEIVLKTNNDKKLTDVLDNENFMITFSKSPSKNFNRALFLAKEKSDHFFVSEDEGQEIFQAVYQPENYLNFIMLYELISNWKSTFIFKNGEMIDKKTLAQINYCYGDKIRSHDDSFCFGASMFTENPFGCHRLMIHSGQRPWHKWKRFEDREYVYIDKEGMKKQINAKAKTFGICPAFNYDNIISTLEKLPNKIDKKSKLYNDLYNPSPRYLSETVTIKINIEEEGKQKKNTPKKSNKTNTPIGCATLSLLIPILILILSMFS